MSLPEVWLRGPLPYMPPLLQPVAHALLQAREEVAALMQFFPEIMLWQKPAGLASPAFHLQHLAGVLDRLATYARGEALSEAQLQYLKEEGIQNNSISTQALIAAFSHQIDETLKQLAEEDETRITHVRYVGRSKLPSTALGLYVHAAEHTMRHLGQLLVTVRVLQQNKW